MGGGVRGWGAGSIETKTISVSNLKLKLKLTEAELGNELEISNGKLYKIIIALLKISLIIFLLLIVVYQLSMPSNIE